MRKISLFAIAFASFAYGIGPASAQATRTWVSGLGDDANPCSRTAPCKSFPGAFSKTSTGGIINCIDNGGYGSVAINKSITIDCSPFLGGVLGSGTNGVTVNAPGGTVVLRGLDIEGAGTPTPGSIGVRVIAADTVHIQQSFIFGFQDSLAAGIRIETSSGSPKIIVSDTQIHDNGTVSTGGGIISVPTGGYPFVTLRNVEITNNYQGVANAANGRMRITKSLFSGNAIGIEADPGAQVSLNDSDLNFNNVAISGNTVSFGNNRMIGNPSDGTYPTPVGPTSGENGMR